MQYSNKYRLVFKSYDQFLYMDIKGELTDQEDKAIIIHNKRLAASVMHEFIVNQRENNSEAHITEYRIEEVA
jgi:hypothetical protein